MRKIKFIILFIAVDELCCKLLTFVYNAMGSVSFQMFCCMAPKHHENNLISFCLDFKGKVHVWSLLKTNINLKTDLVTSIGEMLIV